MSTPPVVPSLAAHMGDSPAPLYARVKQMITQQIQSGNWPPHYRVPSESELVSQLGFSRMTINRALREIWRIFSISTEGEGRQRVAALDAPLLIQGETGTGKELVARACHAISDRFGAPFLPSTARHSRRT